MHLKMKKYHMAILYLSKAIKFLEKSNDKTYNHPPTKTQKINPNESLSNQASQKTHEIIFNMGLALYRSGKFNEAFKCFEKVSIGVLS